MVHQLEDSAVQARRQPGPLINHRGIELNSGRPGREHSPNMVGIRYAAARHDADVFANKRRRFSGHAFGVVEKRSTAESTFANLESRILNGNGVRYHETIGSSINCGLRESQSGAAFFRFS